MTVTDQPTLPPVVCQPWCSQRDGHPGERYREDQGCRSIELESPIDLVIHRGDEPDTRGACWTAEARLERESDAGDGPLYIGMTVEGGLPQYRMTPLAARALAAHLTMLADQVESA